MTADPTNYTWAPYAMPSWQSSGAIHGPLELAGFQTGLQMLGMQLQQLITGLVDAVLRQTAIALGAIDIFGVKPFEMLVEIGEDIIASKQQWEAIFAGLAVGDISELVIFLQGLPQNLQDLMDALGQALGNVGPNTALAIKNATINLKADADLAVSNFTTLLSTTGLAIGPLATALQQLIAWLISIPANLISGALNPVAVTLSGTPIGDLLQYINSAGQFSAAQLTGALNGAVTFGGTALSTLLQNLNSTGQFAASQLTGALNGAVTYGGTALSTLLQYLNGSGQFNAGQLTGGINTAVTFSGIALSTLLQYLNSSGQFNAAQLQGALANTVTYGGTALSTFFGNINSSGNLLASGLTGALGTGLTVGGTTLSTLFTNINSSGQLLGPGITGAINTAATVAGQAIGTVQSNAQGLVNGINNAAAGLISGGSTALVDAQTNVQALFAAPVQFLQGLGGGSLFSQAAQNAAYAAAAAAAAAQAAELARQTSAFNAVFNVSPTSSGNVSVSVDFSGMANAANMSGVMSPGSTNMGITSGAAARQVSTTGSDSEVFPTVTTTDYQVITVTLGPLNDLLSGSVPTVILCRSNSARTIMTRLVINVNGGVPVVSLDAEISGSVTSIVSNVAVPTMASGGVIKVYLGDPSSASPTALQVLYNGTPTITASSGVPTIGASNRYVGLKMFCNSAGKFPPGIRSVVYQDNPPPPSSYPHSGRPTVGTKGRLWAPNDVGLIQRDNSSAWETIWGGVLGAFTQPASSGWSWVNQGGASITTALGGEALTVPSSTRNWRLRTRTLTPSSNYIATTYLETAARPFPGGSIQWYSGVGIRNSSSGSFITFGPGYYASGHMCLVVYRWTNATTFSASSFDAPLYEITGGVMPNWYRIRDDGSNRYFEYSLNGVDWISVFSEGRTTFITPDQFCFGATNEATTQDMVVRLRSLAGIS